MAIGLLFPEEKVRRLFSSHSCLMFMERQWNHTITVSFKKMRGIRTLVRFRTEDPVGLSIQGELLEGRFQIVAISKERTILLYDSALTTQNVPSLPKGLYRLRLLADKAAGSLIIKK